MLERIELVRFKGANDLDVRLAPITLLSGLNSSGKSTLIQAICLVRQSFLRDSDTKDLKLRGPLVQFGTWADVLNHGADQDFCQVALHSKEGRWVCQFGAEVSDSSAKILSAEGRLPCQVVSDDFQVLAADRVSPSARFPQVSGWSALAGPLGMHGEFCADVLARASLAGLKVSSSRRHAASGSTADGLSAKVGQTDSVVDQVSLWMQDFSPGVRVRSELVARTDDVRVIYDYVGRSGLSESSTAIRPTNVGFGLTYSMPVVVALLLGRPGSLLLLENPEAHLHPRGQSRLGLLVAKAAMDGVQIVVESHSDHFLNGIRLAVKLGVVPPEAVACHFFSRDSSTGNVGCVSPAILADGSIPYWPDGFFDEWDRALEQLLG